jgi:hypothetical protein
MAGIVITGIENIDEEEDYDRIEKERVRRLRESTLNDNKAAIEQKKLEDEAKKNAAANRQNQTSVQVTSTPNGTKTTTTTTSTDGTKTTETVETSGGVDDDPFTEEVEGADDVSDSPITAPQTQEIVNPEEAKKQQNQIEGFNQSQMDSKKEDELLKQGVDPSDVKTGEENKRESVPDNPKENPADPVVNKPDNNGNSNTKTEHCTQDNKTETKQEQGEKAENVLIGEDPNAQKSEIIIPDASATCPSPNLNSLNDFQREVLWVALDMLKWQPTTDINTSTNKKSRWDYHDVSDTTKKSFYDSYIYPNDPTFGRFKHKHMLPLDRLWSFWVNSANKNVDLYRAEKDTAWCGITASVIYMFAFLQMQATHKTNKLKKKPNGSRIWSPFENKTIQMPFIMSNNSALCLANNSRYFDYKLSWEPTPGALFWKINNKGADPKGDCGHTGIVVDKTKDGSIITIEGNGGQDYSLRVWPRDNYYQDAWRISHKEGYVKDKIFDGNDVPSLKNCTDDQIKRGRLLPVGTCHYSRDDAKWGGVKVPFPYPTDSPWHWIFLNPATDTELLDIKGKPSREGNPLPEIYSLLDGFYNPEGSKGTANSSAVR